MCVYVVIYEALCFNMAQGRMNEAPNGMCVYVSVCCVCVCTFGCVSLSLILTTTFFSYLQTTSKFGGVYGLS